MLDGLHKEVLRNGDSVLKLVQAAGMREYASIACYVLISFANESGVNFNLEDGILGDYSHPESSGAALFLAQRILSASLDILKDFETFQKVLYLLHQTPVLSNLVAFVAEKTELFFDDNDEQPFAPKELYSLSDSEESDKKRRKFVYLTLFLLDQWVSRTFQAKLAGLAGTETPSQDIQRQFLKCYLSSFVIKD